MPFIQINRSKIYKLVCICTGVVTIKTLNDELLHAANDNLNEKNYETLLSVNLMARHGARTPMSLVHELDQVIF